MHKVKLYGKEYPSSMTMGAMIDFKRQTGKDVNDIGAELELLTLFMFCCVRSACRADGITFDMEFDHFADGINLEDFAQFQENLSEGAEGSKKKKMKA